MNIMQDVEDHRQLFDLTLHQSETSKMESDREGSHGNGTATSGSDDHLASLLSETTVHGLPFLHRDNARPRRVIWGISLIIISMGVFLHIGYLTLDFVANDTSIDVRIIEARELEFPAVTVCNANPIKKSALVAEANHYPQLQQLLDMDGSGGGSRKRKKRQTSCDEEFTGNTAAFNSPNYPAAYPVSVTCHYRFTAPAGMLVKLIFDFFEIEYQRKCTFDVVLIYDGHTVSDPLLSAVCGVLTPGSFIQSTGTTMLMKFISDDVLPYPGFTGNYVAVQDPNAPPPSPTPPPTGATPPPTEATPPPTEATPPPTEATPPPTGATPPPTGATPPPTGATPPPTGATPPPTGATPPPTGATPPPTEATPPPTGATPPPTGATPPPTGATPPPTGATPPPTEATPPPTGATPPPTGATPPPTGATPPPTGATPPPTGATPPPTGATPPPTGAIPPPTGATPPPTVATPPPTEATPPPTEATPPPTGATPPPTEATPLPTEATSPPTEATSPPPTTLLLTGTTSSPTVTASPTNETSAPSSLTSQLTGGASPTITIQPTTFSEEATLLSTKSPSPACSSSPCRNGATCSNTEDAYTCSCTESYVGNDCQFEKPIDGGVVKAFKNEELVTQVLAGLPEDIKKIIGFQTSDMIYSCRYSGRICNITESFKSFSNPFHGNCYTFNGDSGGTSASYLSSIPGRRYGLELGINVGQTEALNAASSVAGAIILVHSRDNNPFPEDYGIMLTPGVFNVISLRLIQLHRMAAPYGDCIESDVDTGDRNAYEELFDAKYSRIACKKTCYQQRLVEACGCAVPYYPRTGRAFGYRNFSLCEEENMEQVVCQAGIDADFAANKLGCNCPDPCREKVFVPTKSTASWPAQQRMNATMGDLSSTYPAMFTISTDDNNADEANNKILKNNFMKVIIAYQDLNHEIIQEHPSYTFVGDCGGMLGLWIGLSSLGLVQIIECAIKGCVSMVSRWKMIISGKVPNKPSTGDTQDTELDVCDEECNSGASTSTQMTPVDI